MNTKSNILLIEDDAHFRKKVAKKFLDRGIDVDEASDYETALSFLSRKKYGYVIIDHNLHGVEQGLNLAKYCIKNNIDRFAIVTGQEDDETALSFFKLGINTFYPKSSFNKYIEEIITNIANISEADEFEALFEKDFLTKSNDLKQEIISIASGAFLQKSLFLGGETGVGKTNIAKIIHQISGVKGNFVHVNCGQVEDQLIDSELFGHVKGAFSGADSKKTGKIKLAHNGTLFLDEIGNISKRAQEKLLVAIEEKKFYPLGSDEEEHSNFRLVCATKEDLLQLVKANKFREDLFYRITGMNLIIPPLRERKEDITLLMDHFLKQSAKKIIIAEDAKETLLKYYWPGNVRELQKLISSFQSYKSSYITNDLLPDSVRAIGSLPGSTGVLTPEQLEMIRTIGLESFIDLIEKEALKTSLDHFKGKKISAIEDLKISKTIFYRIFRGLQSDEN